MTADSDDHVLLPLPLLPPTPFQGSPFPQIASFKDRWLEFIPNTNVRLCFGFAICKRSAAIQQRVESQPSAAKPHHCLMLCRQSSGKSRLIKSCLQRVRLCIGACTCVCVYMACMTLPIPTLRDLWKTNLPLPAVLHCPPASFPIALATNLTMVSSTNRDDELGLFEPVRWADVYDSNPACSLFSVAVSKPCPDNPAFPICGGVKVRD